MEAAEVTKFSIDSEPPIPFGIVRTEHGNVFAVITRKTVHVVRLKYSSQFDGALNYSLSLIEHPPLFVPSKGLEKDSVSVFTEATHGQKLSLLTDPNLMSSELKINDQMMAIQSVRWSPPIEPSGDHYLMCLTNLGGCEIVSENKCARKWSRVIVDVGKFWLQHAKPVDTERLKSFEAVEQTVDRIRLTACCWSKFPLGNKLPFVTIAKNGCVAFQEIIPTSAKNAKPQITFQHELSLPKVNALEWIMFWKKKQLKSYLLCGDINGDASIHELQINSSGIVSGIPESIFLFNEGDGVPVNGVTWEYSEKLNRLLITFCKGMHFFVFVLGDDLRILAKHIHRVGHFTITGESTDGHASLKYSVSQQERPRKKIVYIQTGSDRPFRSIHFSNL